MVEVNNLGKSRNFIPKVGDLTPYKELSYVHELTSGHFKTFN